MIMPVNRTQARSVSGQTLKVGARRRLLNVRLASEETVALPRIGTKARSRTLHRSKGIYAIRSRRPCGRGDARDHRRTWQML